MCSLKTGHLGQLWFPCQVEGNAPVSVRLCDTEAAGTRLWGTQQVAADFGEHRGTLGNDCFGQFSLLSEENLTGLWRCAPGSAFSPLLPSWLFFINGLAKATDSMWIGFIEDRKLGGTANVLDEGAGTKQTPADWDHGPILT